MLRASAPEREQDPQVGTVHESILVEIGFGERRVRPPLGEHDAEIGAVHVEVTVDVGIHAGGLLADIRDAVGIGISNLAGEDLSVVDDAVVVSVGGPFEHKACRHKTVVVVTPCISRNKRPHSSKVVGKLLIRIRIW